MTVYLDRRFRRVGRIKKAAGTTRKPVIKALNAMLDGLYNGGRLDVLRGIQKGQYTLLQVFEFYRVNELEKLPTAATMGELQSVMSAWIDDKECSDAHRRSLHQSLRHILSVAKRTPAISDLPELLEELRIKLKAAKHPVSFNRAKSAAQAFVKSRLKKNHPLYFAVSAVESLVVKPQREKNPLNVDQFRYFVDGLSNDARLIAEAMAFTGMGWTEYVGKWNDGIDRIHIYGTKRTGRERFVPRISAPIRVAMSYKVFRAEVSKNSGGKIRPYDFRRTYANLLEDAQIPRTRRKLYMGHGATDVTDLYERRDVERFLAEDAKRLQKLLGATAVPMLKLEKKA